MTIQTSKSNFDKVSEKVGLLIKNEIKYEKIEVDESKDQYVSCFIDKLLKINFQKKF